MSKSAGVTARQAILSAVRRGGTRIRLDGATPDMRRESAVRTANADGEFAAINVWFAAGLPQRAAAFSFP